jgi:hypothetical protein
MPLKAHQPPRIKKPKLLRSNPLRKSLIISGVNPSELDGINDEDIYVGYRRESFELKVQKDPDEIDNDLSDYVKFRLFLARQLALMKYHEVHGSTDKA